MNNVSKTDNKFAKLYERNGIQVLVVKTTDDDGNPAIELSTKPEGMDLISMTFSFHDTPEGLLGRDREFDYVNEEGALAAASEMAKNME